MLVGILEFSFWLTDGRGRTAGFFFTNNIFLMGKARVLYESIFFNNSIYKLVASLFS